MTGFDEKALRLLQQVKTTGEPSTLVCDKGRGQADHYRKQFYAARRRFKQGRIPDRSLFLWPECGSSDFPWDAFHFSVQEAEPAPTCELVVSYDPSPLETALMGGQNANA